MRRLLSLILALYSLTAGAAVFKPEFPRLGGMKIGTPQDYGVPSTQQQLARLDYIVIDFYRNWGGGVVAEQAALHAMKLLNPNLVIVDYTIVERIHNVNAGVQFARDKLDAQGWWLYPYGTTPPKVDNADNTATTNLTNFVPVDGSGYRWNTWFATQVFTDMWSQLP